MPKISPHSIVDKKASLAEDVEVGPFCTVGPEVAIGAGTRLMSHVVIMGRTKIGSGTVIHPNCVLGDSPQDRKYRGAATRLEIGDNNIFREHVTIHIGTEKGGGITRVGDGNYLMVNAHAGHDVQIGDNALLANNVMLGGHVIIGDNVNLMGGAAVHHLVTVGEYSFIGGFSRIHHDVPPFCKVDGADVIRTLNAKGLKMNGFPDADIEALEDAHRALFSREKPLAVAMAQFDANNGLNPFVRRLIEFLDRRTHSRHGRYLESQLRMKG
jgi:UDP-N-acetylglucosamine acyltransferase